MKGSNRHFDCNFCHCIKGGVSTHFQRTLFIENNFHPSNFAYQVSDLSAHTFLVYKIVYFGAKSERFKLFEDCCCSCLFICYTVLWRVCMHSMATKVIVH